MKRAGLRTLAVALTAVAVLGLPAVPSDGSQSSVPSVELRVSRGGFRPARLRLRRGELVHVVLTSADGEHCFAFDALRIEKRVVAGRPTRFDITPERSGVFPFHCCLESGAAAERERGEMTVSD
jgi:heme/copper-type cytochrome/quinol oxidase subunit 2